jgi:hypothetical protein
MGYFLLKDDNNIPVTGTGFPVRKQIPVIEKLLISKIFGES